MKQSSTFRRVFLIATLALQLSFLASPLRAAAGDVDLSFDPGSGINGTVNAVAVQPDGKILIGGAFTTVKGLARPGLARLNADGSGDSTFNPAGMPGDIEIGDLQLQTDAKVVVCGWHKGYQKKAYAARLNSDGTLDNPFASAVAADVYGSRYQAIAIQPDGKVVLAGYFTEYFVGDDGGANYPPRARVIRLNANGTPDAGFTTVIGNYNTAVSAIAAQPGGGIVLCGLKPALSRLTSEGILDATFNPVVDSCLAVKVQPDGKLVIGGYFLTVNGTSRRGIARLTASGALDATFKPGLGIDNQGGQGTVRAIALQDADNVVIAGEFTAFNGSPRVRIARLNANGTLDPTFDPGTSAPPFIHSIAAQGDGKTLLVGRFFSPTNRDNARRLEANGSLDGGFDIGRGIDGSVDAVAVQTDGKIVIGGGFVTVRGVSRSHIARLNGDGTLDTTFNAGTGVDGPVFALVLQPDAKLLIAGSFSSVNGTNRRCIARLNADGSLDSSFNPGLSIYDHARAIVLQPDGKVVVGSTYGICRLNANGSRDGAFQPNLWPGNSVLALALRSDGKLLVAGYSATFISDPVNGDHEDFAARLIQLTAAGDIDTGFAPFIGEAGVDYRFAQAVTIQPDGKVLLGGNFSTIHDANRHWIGRLQPDGTLDSTFDPGAGVTGVTSTFEDLGVKCIAVQSDGRVLISGNFSGVDSFARSGIARLNPDGSLDSSFNPGLGAPGGVNSLVLQSDARVLIGGGFTAVNGVARSSVARLQSHIPTSFAGWADAFGLAGPALAPDADPDGDGSPNAAEYVTGGNPSRASVASLPTLARSAGNVIFTFSRADASETPDVGLVLEASTDLLTWPEVFIVGTTTATSSSGVTIAENGPGPDTITLALPIAGHVRYFARLKVVVTP